MPQIEAKKSSLGDLKELRKWDFWRPRGTTGEKICAAGFAGNLFLVASLVGIRVAENYLNLEIDKNIAALIHMGFDLTILGGVFQLRREAQHGKENWLFRPRKKPNNTP